MDILPRPRVGPETMALELLNIARFSENKADVVSVEIRIRKLEFNLSKQVAYEEKKKKDEEARLAAKKAREAAERAAFNRIASTNDGQLRIEAARRLRKPIKGDPKYDEFVDTDDEEEEAVVDKKPKASEEADGADFNFFQEDFDRVAVLEILARAAAFCSIRSGMLPD